MTVSITLVSVDNDLNYYHPTTVLTISNSSSDVSYQKFTDILRRKRFNLRIETVLKL